ncbi:MAG: SGNH/GDSL hydrolase family protein [Clostridia bacterium]|nr:SGNH/GDSL hydrolase family protein [Clostridia bacterium]
MKILFQGDSITDGNRYKDEASRWDLNHQIGHSWAYMVTGKLMGEYPRRYVCVNRGVSGDNVLRLKARWQKDCLDEKPDVLALLIGVNDCAAIVRGEFTEETYGQVYRELLAETKRVSPGVKFILLEPFHLSEDENWIRVMEVLRPTVKEIAGEFGAVFVPLQEEFRKRAEADGSKYWLWDGVHPTEAGHWVVARRVLEQGAEVFGIGGAAEEAEP